jgi:hypothetical protein
LPVLRCPQIAGFQLSTEGKAMHDNTEYLGNTILDRCVRVLQARDEIGFQFYRRQNNSTRDAMLYHFDFLTVMMSGALDAQARVARTAYDVTKPSIFRTSFRREEFLKALRAQGANKLVDVVEAPEFSAFLKLLGALRNSIHSIGLRGLAVSQPGQQQSSVVRIFEDAGRIWDASAALDRERLGVTSLVGVCIEPYTTASCLANLGLQFVNAVAANTDTTRLLPRGTDPSVPEAPPPDGLWRPDVRERIDALG